MTETSQRLRNVLICLCLAGAITFVYWPVRHFQFTNWDDPNFVTANAHVQRGLTLEGLKWAFTTQQTDYWHPLTWLSHMLDCQLFGLNAGAHHLVNVVLHILNTLLLFSVLRRMTQAPWRSGFVAALFALHPLHVGSVAWVAERKDLLSATFWMLTMGAYVLYCEQPTRKRYWSALGLYVLGLMAKPMLVTLPFVLLLLDYWPLGRTRWADAVAGSKPKASLKQLLLEKIPFLAVALASSVVTVLGHRNAGAVRSLERTPLNARVANTVVSYVRYIERTCWPRGLSVFYPYQTWSPYAVMGGLVVLIGVSGAVFWWRRRHPCLVVGWLWYLGVLGPVNGLVQVGDQSIADHYTYLPLIGLFLMAAWCFEGALPGQRFRSTMTVIVAIGLLGASVLLSRIQVGYWKDNETLFRHALDVTRDNAVAHFSLGNALLDAGKTEEAIMHYREAARISPGYANVHNSLGIALAQEGKLPEATEQLELAVQLKPDFAEAHYNLGHALVLQGKMQEAADQFSEELRITPDDAEAHDNLGNALAALGKVHEAVSQYEQTLQLTPDNPDAQNNLARLLSVLSRPAGGDPVRALALAQRACESTGYETPAYLDTLALAEAANGHLQDAIATARKAMELARSTGQTELAGEIGARLELYQAARKPAGAARSPN